MHYEIKRAYNGGPLTPKQRTSSLFAEEPVVLGKVLRRGSGSLKLTPEQYEANKIGLLRLENAGAILIVRPAENTVPSTPAGDAPSSEQGTQELSPSQGEASKEKTDDQAPSEPPPVVDPVGTVPSEPVAGVETAAVVQDAASTEVIPGVPDTAPVADESTPKRRKKKEQQG